MRRLPLNILKLLGIIVLLIFLFLSSNYTINWFERNYNNDVDYQSLKEYSHKLGLSENYAIVVNFEKPSGKHRFLRTSAPVGIKKHPLWGAFPFVIRLACTW